MDPQLVTFTEEQTDGQRFVTIHVGDLERTVVYALPVIAIAVSQMMEILFTRKPSGKIHSA